MNASAEIFSIGKDWATNTRFSGIVSYISLKFPFYYIEYGIAQLGALQLWNNARHDPQDRAS